MTHLPSVDKVLAWPAVAALAGSHGRTVTLEAVRGELAALRAARSTAGEEAIATGVAQRIDDLFAPSLRRVLNLTGTVLHTNLGRAPLPPQAIAAMVEVAAGASNLEYDLEGGARGDRDSHVEAWLCRLTGAEAATVVNNNAAAVLLALNTLALRREVVVSRGELVEIGGAFRLPDIMARAGCKLREVGTTNRTHLRDYEEAVTPSTALLMKAHTSNYRVEGFTAAAPEKELADLAARHGLPLFVDLGSGTLTDLRRYGLPHEPTPAETLSNGASLVSFSGDKLLGGPQAGMLVGRADLIAKIRKNPMKRALRCDKLTLAALSAVLRLYGAPDNLAQTVPAIRLLARGADHVGAVAQRVLPAVTRWLAGEARVEVAAVQSQIGSGSLPVDLLPSFALAIRPAAAQRSEGRWLESMAARFRGLRVPVIGRIHGGALLFDLRCLEDEAEFMALFEPEPPA